MNQYEVVYIIDAGLEDQARTDLIERFSGLVTSNGGQVDRVDEWGKRRLAYSINYKTEGYYVLMYITAPTALPRELERNFKISESILRYLTIRFEGELPPKREPLKAAAPAAAPVVPAAAPVAPAAPAAEVTEAPAQAAPEVQAAPEAQATSEAETTTEA